MRVSQETTASSKQVKLGFCSNLLMEQLPLLKDLRLLSARLFSFRALFAEVNGVTSTLPHPFLIKMYNFDASLYNEAVAKVMNISVEESSEPKIIQDCPPHIPFLMDALKFPNNFRHYITVALSQLPFNDSNSLAIRAFLSF